MTKVTPPCASGLNRAIRSQPSEMTRPCGLSAAHTGSTAQAVQPAKISSEPSLLRGFERERGANQPPTLDMRPFAAPGGRTVFQQAVVTHSQARELNHSSTGF